MAAKKKKAAKKPAHPSEARFRVVQAATHQLAEAVRRQDGILAAQARELRALKEQQDAWDKEEEGVSETVFYDLARRVDAMGSVSAGSTAEGLAKRLTQWEFNAQTWTRELYEEVDRRVKRSGVDEGLRAMLASLLRNAADELSGTPALVEKVADELQAAVDKLRGVDDA
jgi:hypothetical protein